jgi:hypothetical protein
MRSFAFFYWSFLIFVAGLLAYVSVISLVPFAFIAGGIAIALGFVMFLVVRFRRTGLWDFARLQARFVTTLLMYIAVFWTVVGLLTTLL